MLANSETIALIFFFSCSKHILCYAWYLCWHYWKNMTLAEILKKIEATYYIIIACITID